MRVSGIFQIYSSDDIRPLFLSDGNRSRPSIPMADARENMLQIGFTLFRTSAHARVSIKKINALIAKLIDSISQYKAGA